ncbi:scn4aa [Symbiodinium sp. CCMP2592]|nr:scn4aa [Symbiodinium sp. CCMP2592]
MTRVSIDLLRARVKMEEQFGFENASALVFASGMPNQMLMNALNRHNLAVSILQQDLLKNAVSMVGKNYHGRQIEVDGDVFWAVNEFSVLWPGVTLAVSILNRSTKWMLLDECEHSVAIFGIKLAATSTTAVGAWAARLEAACLLEARCSPEAYISLVREGVERGETSVLDFASLLDSEGNILDGNPFKLTSDLLDQETAESDLPQVPIPLWEEDARKDDEVAKQRAILESLAQNNDSVPPWAISRVADDSSPSSNLPEWIVGGPFGGESGFHKKAAPPPKEILQPTSFQGDTLAGTPNAGDPETCFAKKASPPESPQQVETRLSAAPRLGSVSLAAFSAPSMRAREEIGLQVFVDAAIECYKFAFDSGIDMDLINIAGPPDNVDRRKFQLHTAPNKASTGIRYARLFKQLQSFCASEPRSVSEDAGVMDKLGVLDFVELLVQRGSGKKTPQSLLYAFDYFSKVFGFELEKRPWERAKRLALRYAQADSDLPNRAPMFRRKTLFVLEQICLDPCLADPWRVAAGKLRLCAQASIRHDDLLNTPLKNCEWIRRSAARGKSGPRLWVASIKGVCKSGDNWLNELMVLVLKSHGNNFGSHDHFGRLPTHDNLAFVAAPASLSADVRCVKEALLSRIREGIDVGMSEKEVNLLRWHGAKATMTSYMQHLGISPRAVRFSGNWRQREDSMPDSYLREAQTLVLAAQERCLAFLRGGSDISFIQGVPVGDVPAESVGTSQNTALPSPSELDAMVAADDSPVAADAMCMQFLDELVELGLPNVEAIDAEKSRELVQQNVESLIVEGVESEVKEEADAPVQEDIQSSELPLQLDIFDSEGLVCYFVQLSKPGSSAKLHLADAEQDGKPGPATAVPRCKATGSSFSFVNATEALDEQTELCRVVYQALLLRRAGWGAQSPPPMLAQMLRMRRASCAPVSHSFESQP